MKTVVVTGASSGIGKEIAKTFARNDWKVLAIARNPQRLKELKHELAHCETFTCDLGNADAVKDLGEKLSVYDVDVLVNNAGLYQPCSVDQDDDDVWRVHFQNNLMSAVRLTRQLWPQLKKQKGLVLNISSTLAIRPIANTGAYSALKAAMNNWTLTLALEGAPYGVRANGICPGLVDTPIHSYVGSSDPEDKKTYQGVQGLQPLGRTGRPEDIAVHVYHLAQPECQWTTGALLNIDGGILLNS